VNPGRLRHLVTVQKQVETQNAYGEPEVSWSDVVKNVCAEILPIRGREYWAAKQINADIEAKVVMRYRSDVTAKMRLLHGTDEYYIDSIINVEQRDRTLELMCTRSIE
jgi:SPP1 family predicted phage head-tail adaptor